ncbi:MAG: hypothetical protein AB1586_31795 [Pseudomonadota bacterium]
MANETFTFTDELLDALGAWQRGWRENQALKKPIAEKLVLEAAKLPARFCAVPNACYRKRFLYKGDMEPLVMFGGLDDGVASWTMDRVFDGRIKSEFARIDDAMSALKAGFPQRSTIKNTFTATSNPINIT